MLFNSYEFIFLFLPITLLGYFVLGARSHKLAAAFLATASFAFYAWWDSPYVALLAGSATFNFVVGRSLAARPKRRGALLLVGVTVNLALLGWYKYANFFVDTAVLLTGADLFLAKIALPLGISFFTFTQIAFLVDAHRGAAREYDPIHFALFVSFFPHLIAGPILHHKEMMPQFHSRRPYSPNWHRIALGLTLFSLGLFKKVVIADGIAPFANDTFAAAAAGHAIDFFQGWSGALAYTFQIYFDFSGYSDMAIGSALLFGIRLPINFNSPYKATSIIDFWRRWHMTLSRFLRDYLYFSLGGNRKGPTRTYINLMVVMLLGGLWHGAGWTFVVWGGLHGFYLLANHAWRTIGGGGAGWVARLWAWPLTFTAVVVAWVFFRAPDLDAALAVVQGMAGLNGMTLGQHQRAYFGPLAPLLEQAGVTFGIDARFSFLVVPWILACLALSLIPPNTQQWVLGEGRAPGAWLAWTPVALWAVVLGVAVVAAIGFISGQSEFLYFNF